MHITLESDYAVRIVDCLANEGKRLDAKTIAENTCVTLRFSLKILRKLVSAGIIKSFKGTLGGYELAKKPEEITLKDVIEAVEGTYMLNRCLDDNYLCTRGTSNNCPYQNAFREVSEVVNNKLQEYNFKMFIKNNN